MFIDIKLSLHLARFCLTLCLNFFLIHRKILDFCDLFQPNIFMGSRSCFIVCIVPDENVNHPVMS